ncbi:MAG: glucosaminidase domain-containing protein [Bacteroidales bacterium]|jgi:LysM repeat protein|nr:glucosaminidase domain-containing protein [Bacteroidales bacterium]
MKRFVSVVLLIACACAAFGQRVSRIEYIEQFASIAVSEMHRTGIPASITLAQACLESGDGNSELTRKSNNHFGIKCYGSWQGKRVVHDDDEKNECFRVYPTATESFKDHSEFIKNGPRYATLFSYEKTDYKNWAHGLKKAGYATNPQYAQMLIKIIEDHELHKYDTMNAPVAKADEVEKVKGTAPNPTLAPPNLALNKAIRAINGRSVYENNNVEYVILQDGETLFSLAQKLSMPVWKLFSFNDLQQGDSLNPGDVVYIEAKRAKAEKPYVSHTVAAGETLHSIAQLYAVKVQKLAQLNKINKKQEVVEGSNVFVGKTMFF